MTFWVRKPDGSGRTNISIWAVSTLGGEPRPYLEGVAEFDWSTDGQRLVYHTPGPGDPLFVSDGTVQMTGRRIFTAPAGLHSHFPLWSPDGSSSISFKVLYRTSWTSGVSLAMADHRTDHVRTIRMCRIQCSWIGARSCTSPPMLMVRDQAFTAWMLSTGSCIA